MTEHEIAFFDRMAPHWDDNERYSTPQRINHILDLVNVCEGMHVLDLGTGTGVMLPYLRQRVGTDGLVVGVDLSEGMLRQAQAKTADTIPLQTDIKTADTILLQADIERERLPGRYHRVLMYCVYPHLQRPVSTIKKIVSQNLVNSGTLTIAFPTVAANINTVHRNRHIYSRILPSPTQLAAQLHAHHIVARSLSTDPYIVTITRR